MELAFVAVALPWLSPTIELWFATYLKDLYGKKSLTAISSSNKLCAF